jgi:hypothetical protein
MLSVETDFLRSALSCKVSSVERQRPCKMLFLAMSCKVLSVERRLEKCSPPRRTPWQRLVKVLTLASWTASMSPCAKGADSITVCGSARSTLAATYCSVPVCIRPSAIAASLVPMLSACQKHNNLIDPELLFATVRYGWKDIIAYGSVTRVVSSKGAARAQDCIHVSRDVLTMKISKEFCLQVLTRRNRTRGWVSLLLF